MLIYKSSDHSDCVNHKNFKSHTNDSNKYLENHNDNENNNLMDISNSQLYDFTEINSNNNIDPIYNNNIIKDNFENTESDDY